MAYAQVAVDTPVGIGQTFSYYVPEGLRLAPGDAVWVPFGKRQVTGVVVELVDFPDVSSTRPVITRLSQAPLLKSYQLNLARWISYHYRASLFESAALMLPPQFRRSQKSVLLENPKRRLFNETSSEEDPILRQLRSRGREDESNFMRELGLKDRQRLKRLIEKGIVQREWEIRRPTVRPLYAEYLRLGTERTRLRQTIQELEHTKKKKEVALLDHLDAHPYNLASQLRKTFGPRAVKILLDKGYLVRETVRQERDPLDGQIFSRDYPLALSPEQERALKSINLAQDWDENPRTFLLWGVTGSGKTEVYLQAIDHCVARGKRALVLVPEISLTTQMVERFMKRFPGRVAVLHSGLSPGKRYDQWWGIQEGRYDVVVGPRSALFAPQSELGLIVVDEEHETAYKEELHGPHYHVRETATVLAKLTGAVVIFGSATPDMVTFHRGQNGQYQILELPNRVGEAPYQVLPVASVEVVDMREELRQGNRSILSRNLENSIQKCLDDRQQGILFLNRRGSAGSVQCRSCGSAVRCARCAVGLTYHSVTERLVCHQCNRRSLVPKNCVQCGSSKIRLLGLGTQRVVDEVQNRFPNARILRWDRDSVVKASEHQEIIRQFQQGDVDFLVGTQMLAKGFHFPRVTLVGVVLADVSLNMPDFRSGERTFQILCQVAGRAGRGAAPGKVIIQTYNPENYAIKHAANQDYYAFAAQELEFRRHQALPPFSRLVRLVYQHFSEEQCRSDAEALGRALASVRDARGEMVDILGPAPAYPARIRGKYRWQLLLRGSKPEELLDSRNLPSGWIVDVDPVVTA